MKPKEDIIIFTDGASSGNPGPGGFGAVVVFPDEDFVEELGEGKANTTNNEMELAAIAAAFAQISNQPGSVQVFSDSSYAINGITKWIRGWENNNWKTRAKEDVSHKELWQKLGGLVTERKEKITWTHLPGHVGVIGNERADEIASSFAQNKKSIFYKGTLSDYKLDILNINIDEIKLAEKKQRSNGGPAYSYLSLVDGELQKHKTWAACEARVKGKDAKFRKAVSKEHEEEILKDWGILK